MQPTTEYILQPGATLADVREYCDRVGFPITKEGELEAILCALNKEARPFTRADLNWYCQQPRGSE